MFDEQRLVVWSGPYALNIVQYQSSVKNPVHLATMFAKQHCSVLCSVHLTTELNKLWTFIPTSNDWWQISRYFQFKFSNFAPKQLHEKETANIQWKIQFIWPLNWTNSANSSQQPMTDGKFLDIFNLKSRISRQNNCMKKRQQIFSEMFSSFAQGLRLNFWKYLISW